MADNPYGKAKDAGAPANPYGKAASKGPSTVDEAKMGALNAMFGLTTGLSDPVFGTGQLALNAANSAANNVNAAFRGVTPAPYGLPGVRKPDTWLQGVTDKYNEYLTNNEKMYQQATPGSIPAGLGRFAGNMVTGGMLLPEAPKGMGPVAAAVNGAKTGVTMGATAPVYLNSNSGEDYWAQKAHQEAIAAGFGAGLPYGGRLLGRMYGAIEPMLPWATKKVVGDNILRNVTQDAELGGTPPVDNGVVGNFVDSVKQGLTGKTPATPTTTVPTPAQLNLSAINGPRPVAEVQQRLQQYLAKPFVPGSKLTTAQVINTDAAARGEKALVNGENGVMFGNQSNVNNDSRLAALAKIAKTPDDLQAAIDNRTSVTGPMYRKAFSQDYTPDDTLNELLQQPNVQAALKRGQTLLKNKGDPTGGITPPDAPVGLLDASGVPFESTQPSGTISGQALQAIKLGLQAMREEGAANGMKGLEQDALKAQQQQFHGWLKNNVPDYLAADAKYAELSKPINDMSVAQTIKNGLGVMEDPSAIRTSSDALTDAQRKAMTTAGQTRLTLNNFNASMRKALNGPDGEYGVTPETAGTLDAIAADLQRAGSGANAVEKTGSDTAYNLQAPGMVSKWLYGDQMQGGSKVALPGMMGSLGSGTGFLLGSLFGPEAAGAAAMGGMTGGAKAGQMLGASTAERLNGEFAKAMLDPEYYSMLLHEALVRQQGGLLSDIGNAAPQATSASGLLNSL